MVRFSCFTTHIPYHKSKKSVQQSVVEMHKELKLSKDQTPVHQSGFEISNPPHLQTGDTYIPVDSPDKITSPLSFDGCWKSEELNGNSYSEDIEEGLCTVSLKKSQSLGSGLDREGRISCGIDMEDETDRGLSANDSHEMIHDRIFEAFDGTSPQELHNHKEMMEDHGVVHNEHLFSIEDLNHSIEGLHQDFGAEQSVDHLVHSGDGIPRTPAIAKSHSLPNFRAFPAIPDVGSPSHWSMVARSRSFDDLCTPHVKRVEHTSGDEGVCLGMTYHKLRDESFNEEIPPTPNLFGNFSLSRVVSIEDCLICIEVASLMKRPTKKCVWG
ncbi:hypothetical protein QJS10_CPA01g01084 [Acorus calamus]|uniref:Uncharacterized protein n=1 Tax=Acorus calamus TaxID=4465 RepID=A0AAV9FNB9_ACOCL|nr:hypothetical protein QJS10_CPA01g01084 [Acorus calamus]